MSAVLCPIVDGLHWSEDGYASLHGALLERAQALDAVICGWASAIGATDYRFPSMISASDLAPVAYLKSFPHLATFVTSGDRQRASLEAIAAEYGTAAHIPPSADLFEPVAQLLTPAACYHFYPVFADRDLDTPTFLTTNCLCHRRETRYLPLQRQWCFQMREIVCIGDPETIDGFIAALCARIDRLTGALGLRTGWETASDPFFDADTDPKALAQMLEPSKQELRTQAGLAIASVNRHRSFFGEGYGIRFRGQPARSACVAFGIERWLFALLEAHGTDIAAWPTPEGAR